jgi:MFS family permease
MLLPAGALADRLPRSRVILLSALVRAIGQAILGLLFIKGVGALWAIVLIQMVNGAASAFDRPAAVGLIPTLVQPSDVQPANALLSLSQSIGLIAGPAIAAVIIATAGAGWALLLDAASFAAAALLLARLPAGVAPRRAPQGLLADIREGGRALVRRAWLLFA